MFFLYQEFGCILPESLNRSLDQASTPSDQGCGSGPGVRCMVGSGYFKRNRFMFSSEGSYPDPVFSEKSGLNTVSWIRIPFSLKIGSGSVFLKVRIRFFLKRWIRIRSIRIRHSSDHPIYQTEASRVIRTFILQEQDVS